MGLKSVLSVSGHRSDKMMDKTAMKLSCYFYPYYISAISKPQQSGGKKKCNITVNPRTSQQQIFPQRYFQRDFLKKTKNKDIATYGSMCES